MQRGICPWAESSTISRWRKQCVDLSYDWCRVWEFRVLRFYLNYHFATEYHRVMLSKNDDVAKRS